MTVRLDNAERQRLAPLVMSILDEWQLTDEAQIALLGLPERTKPRELSRFRQGSQPLPDEDDIVERSRHIVGIQEALHVVFAKNPNMPAFWVANRHNRQFGRAPMEIMLEEGLDGMQRVWGHLDCTRNW